MKLETIKDRVGSRTFSNSASEKVDKKIYKVDRGTNEMSVLHLSSDDLHRLSLKADHHTIILSKKGNCSIKSGYHIFTVGHCSLTIIPPNQTSSFSDITQNYQGFCILFKPEFLAQLFPKQNLLNNLLDIDNKLPPFYELSASECIRVMNKFLQVEDEFSNQKPFFLNILRLEIFQILFEYNRACKLCYLNAGRNLTRGSQLFKEYKKLVDKNYLTERMVWHYANRLGITPKHLNDCVKNETGKSALKIIHNRIIIEAKFKLENSSDNIKQIALSLNFQTTSHFSRFFKNNTEMSPIAYRRAPSKR